MSLQNNHTPQSPTRPFSPCIILARSLINIPSCFISQLVLISHAFPAFLFSPTPWFSGHTKDHTSHLPSHQCPSVNSFPFFSPLNKSHSESTHFSLESLSPSRPCNFFFPPTQSFIPPAVASLFPLLLLSLSSSFHSIVLVARLT